MKYLLLMMLATLLVCSGCGDDSRGTGGSDSDSDGDTDSDSYQYVYGAINCSQCQELVFEGTLYESGADYYGYCQYSDGEFRFEVGHDDEANVSGANEAYLYVSGIPGPPVQGVFDELGQVKDDEALFTDFGHITLKNVNTYNIGSNQLDDSCAVELFAEPADGELTPFFGKSFDYYVHINCQGLDDVTDPDSSVSINSIRLEFYLDGCN